MSRLTWFPLYVDDFRIDTLELNVDELGVYFTMLVLCYGRGGPLPGDDEDLKRILQKQIAKFHGHSYNRIVPKLLKKYFYRDEAGDWRQKRVELELERAREFSEKQRNRVTKRWAKDAPETDKPSTNAPQTSRKRSANGLQTDERSLKYNDNVHTNNNTIQYNTDSPRIAVVDSPPSSGGRRAGKALPEDWKPDEGLFAYGEAQGLTRDQTAAICEDMRLWAISNSNRSVGRKANWTTAMQGAIRRDAHKYKSRIAKSQPRQSGQDWLADLYWQSKNPESEDEQRGSNQPEQSDFLDGQYLEVVHH